MSNLFNLSEEEKNRIRGLHLVESKDNRITSVLSEQGYDPKSGDDVCITVNFESGDSNINDIGADSGDNLWITISNRLRNGMRG